MRSHAAADLSVTPKVVAEVFDAGSGELRSLRVPAWRAQTVEWVRVLPAPVRVARGRPDGLRSRASLLGCRDRLHCRGAVEVPPASGERVKTDRWRIGHALGAPGHAPPIRAASRVGGVSDSDGAIVDPYLGLGACGAAIQCYYLPVVSHIE